MGLECYGKNFEYKLIRCILYNISVSTLSKVPMGIVVIPIGWLFKCGLFAEPTIYNGRKTIITCIKDVCPRYGKCQEFMAQYEYKKDNQIELIRTRQFGEREFNRLETAEKIAKDKNFQMCRTKDERMSIARLLVQFGTPEKLIVESVALARAIDKGRVDIDSLRKLGGKRTTEGNAEEEKAVT